MQNFNHIIAKSNGMISLTNHSLIVAGIARSICKLLELDKDITNYIVLGALLHDIGKINKNFQDYILGKEIPEQYICHNVLSWAVLSRHINDSKLKHSLQGIATHHSENDSDKTNNLLEDFITDGLLSNDDINNMIDFTTYIISRFDENLLYVLGKIELNDDIISKPNFYDKTQIDKTILFRGILVSADRLASALSIDDQYNFINSEQLCDNYIQSLVTRTKWVLNPSNNIDINRYNKQLKIIDDIIKFRTVILKAPAGYGKTLAGIIWALNNNNNKKIIWVCPRNEVAENVYKNILNDLNLLGINNISVELYLTSKRQNCTDDSLEDFSSDIIVTNLDNYINPTIKNSAAYKQFFIAATDVIFDEFHESTTQEPLFALFVNLAKMRIKYTNSKTLFLSATPSLIHKLLNDGNIFTPNPDKEIHIYPSENSHLPAIHNIPYVVNNFGIFNDCDDLSKYINKYIADNDIKEGIFFEGTVPNSQILANNIKANINIHSKFTPEHRKNYTDIIYKVFGKNTPPKNRNLLISSTSLLGCAANISTQYTFINITSPEDFIQRALGRNNRFKEYIKSFISFYRLNNQSHNMFADYSYTSRLMKLWYDFLTKTLKNKPEITADELYTIYNSFNNFYKREIIEYLKTDYNLSVEKLIQINPKKSNNSHVVNSNTYSGNIDNIGLRGNSKYDKVYLLKHDNSNEFIQMTANIQPTAYNKTIHEYFDEDENSQKILLFYYKTIINNPLYDKYKYSKNPKFIKSLTTTKLTTASSDKPYICTNWTYNNYFGEIKNSTRNKFL